MRKKEVPERIIGKFWSIIDLSLVVAVHLWLGIPVFSEADSVLCSCHQLVDRFGDYLIGCSHGPLRIRRHNALCDIIYYALLEDKYLVNLQAGLVMYFTQTSTMVTLHILISL